MTRPLGPLLLTMSIAVSLTFSLTFSLAVGSAQAQSTQAAPAKETASGPLQSLFGLFQHQAQAQPINRNAIETQSLPAPAFATPNGNPPASPQTMPLQTGHQFDAQQGAANPNANGGPDAVRPPGAIGAAPGAAPAESVMSLPPDDQPEEGQPKELPPNLKRQLVDLATKEPVGTIIVDTANTYLYLVLGGGKAMRYGVRVGREGFTWTGTERISKMKEWPDWHPPTEMIERQPYLPRFMAGGPGNPLGARAMYLGRTLYRIHGTNQPSTIGKYVSSGCVGMLNEDVEDLYSRVQVGTRVVVWPGKPPAANVANAGSQPAANPMAPPQPANPMAPPQANQGVSNSGAPLSAVH